MPLDPDLLARLRAWTHGRQRLGRAAASAAEALRDVVGVYSAHPTTPLALLARSQGFAPTDLADLEQSKAAIRLPAMRLSVFLLPTEQAGPILSVTRLPITKHARHLKHAGLTEEEYYRLRDYVRQNLREPLLPAELPAALAGVRDMSGEANVVTGVRIMGYEGAVLRVGSTLRSSTLRYVATEQWLGHPLPELDPNAALRWLADRYLRAFGPARIADFAWWVGVTRTRAKAALAALDTVDLGHDLLLPADLADDFARVAPLDPAALDAIPKWDSYTMGYAPDGRQRLLDDAHLKLAYSQGGGGTLPGDGFPLLLRGGRAVAIWSHRFSGHKLQITVAPFPGETATARDYEKVFAAIGTLLSATDLTIN